MGFRPDGYLEIDNRESPGLPHLAEKYGISTGKGQVFKARTATCSHCQRIVVLDPKVTRDFWCCTKCDQSLCSECNLSFRLTGICYPWDQRMQDLAIQHLRATITCQEVTSTDQDAVLRQLRSK